MNSLIAEDHLLIESSIRDPELYRLSEARHRRRNLADRPAERALQERLESTLDAILRRTR